MDVPVADFATIGILVVLEGLLSADNALVLAVLILGLPRPDQKKALRYRLVGPLALRMAATALATYFIRMAWVKIVATGVGIGRLLAPVRRHPTVVDAAFLIIAWVGIKLLIEYLSSAGLVHFEIDRWLPLALVVIIFTTAYIRARRKGPVPDDDPLADDASGLLADNRTS